MQYPTLAVRRRGMAKLIHSEEFWKAFPVGFRSMYLRTKEPLLFYDSSAQKWSLSALEPLEPLGVVERLFGGGLRPIPVQPHFVQLGSYSAEELATVLRTAVEADDDILCQHDSRETILRKLATCDTIPKIFRQFRWMTRDFTRSKPKR